MALKIQKTWLELPVSQSVCIWNPPPPPPQFPYISRFTDLCLPLPLHSHLVPGCWQHYLSASWLWPGHRKFNHSHHFVSLETVLRLLLRYVQHMAYPIPCSAPKYMCAHTHTSTHKHSTFISLWNQSHRCLGILDNRKICPPPQERGPREDKVGMKPLSLPGVWKRMS